ncbi:hypothetical protein [Micromonospora saelicesensis]|uniref:hypothetical protein n=1 Tax=Micromonospora saelicesensis TaxID=285676 RepID=UPI0011BF80DA|nr:hypothetical protein [Micromonospora saelicesensis]
MLFKTVVTVLFVIGGLVAIAWVANWPFNTPREKDLTAEQRRIDAAHNRRHHRAAARVMLPFLAILFGITSVGIWSGPKSDPFAAVVMAACSLVCAGVFVALIKRGRRRQSSTRRRP